MPAVEEGMILAKMVAVAIAPHVRAFLNLPGNDTGAEDLGLKRTKLEDLVPVEGVAEVVVSKSPKYKVGCRLWLPMGPLLEYRALRADGKDSPQGMPPFKVFDFVRTETQLSTMSPAAGISAYCAINDTFCGRVDEPGCFSCLSGRTTKIKTVLVTSAAGAVGIVACQLYKNKGCKVVGVTSTREKADRLLDYGCDAAIAYRTESIDERLKELAPEGIDVFFDNVGATQLDAGSKHMKIGGKIIQVGCQAEIDNFSTNNITGWKEYTRLCAREMTVSGFLMLSHTKKIPAAVASMSWMIYRGKLKSAETVISGTFDEWAKCVDKLHGKSSADSFGRLIMTLT
jgi:hypothetical protein